jgi:hypothetical protein
MKSRILRTIEIPGFLLLGMLAAFPAFEIFPENLVRGGYWEGSFCRPDPLTGYRFRPGRQYCSKLFDFRVRVEIGEQGFRCTRPLDRPAEAEIRAVFLGHSQAFCAGCDEEETLHVRVEAILAERHNLEAACYNLSLPGTGLVSQIKILEKYAPALRPTHVLYWGPRSEYASAHPNLVRRLKDQIVGGYMMRRAEGVPRTGLLGHSGLLRLALGAPTWETLGHRRIPPQTALDVAGLFGLRSEEDPQPETTREAAVRGALRLPKEMAAFCRERGADFFHYRWEWTGDTYTYPRDDHVTPEGIDRIAETLASRIARTVR